ncbi:MAG: hypothetical protein HFI75_10060 [Lachnospiraceae bacterium]|nr:hypothetical protein [Lachnospiraceae bacterium]
MCKIVEDYAKEYAAEQKQEWNRSLALEMIRSNYTNDEIHRLLKFSLEEIIHLRKTAECVL